MTNTSAIPPYRAPAVAMGMTEIKPNYSMLDKVVDVIKAFFGNKEARLNLKSNGFYSALQNGRVNIRRGELSSDLPDGSGFYHYILSVDNDNYNISLRLDKNNDIHLNFRELTVNLTNGELVPEILVQGLEKNVKPEELSAIFNHQLNNALRSVGGQPPECLLRVGNEDVMLKTKVIIPLSPEVMENLGPNEVFRSDLKGVGILSHFDSQNKILTGCADFSNEGEYIEGNIIHSRQPYVLAPDICRIPPSTYFSVNGVDISSESIRKAVLTYKDSEEYNTCDLYTQKERGNWRNSYGINEESQARHFFKYIGEKLQTEYGSHIFNGLPPEKGVFLIGLANTQGVTSQPNAMITQQLYRRDSMGVVSRSSKIPPLAYADESPKYIAIEISDSMQVSFKVSEELQMKDDVDGSLEYKNSNNDKIKCQLGEVIRWARCAPFTLGDSDSLSANTTNFQCGYSLKLNEG